MQRIQNVNPPSGVKSKKEDQSTPLCSLAGHSYIKEVQTITQVFFPGKKFRHQFVSGTDEKFDYLCEQTCDTPHYTVASRLTSNESNAAIFYDGKKVSEYSYKNPELSNKRVVMLTLYHALQSAIGLITPWGSLTGVRPSKLVREWMSEGLTRDMIVQRLIDPYCVDKTKAELAVNVAEAEIRLCEKLYSHSDNPVGLYVSIPFAQAAVSTAHSTQHITRKTLLFYPDTLVR